MPTDYPPAALPPCEKQNKDGAYSCLIIYDDDFDPKHLSIFLQENTLLKSWYLLYATLVSPIGIKSSP